MRISDWSSDVCSSDLVVVDLVVAGAQGGVDDAHVAAHDAVLVEAGDAVEQPLESGARGGVLHVAALGAGIDERPQGLERLGVVAAEHPELAREPLATLGEFGLAGLLPRSEEHTSELQSLLRHSYAVFCL